MPNGSDEPRVSIVTPVYNAENFIARCIQSVLDQTYQRWEQIIVDDGSSDNTETVARSFTDPRIHYIRLPHRGLAKLSESYNTAVAQARGDVIAVLEGDDVWLPQKLEQQLPLFDAPDTKLSWARAIIIDEHDVASRRWPVNRSYQRDLPLPELFRVLARWNVLTPALTVMMRKNALDAIGGFQQTGSSMFVDLPTWLTIAGTQSGTARYLDEDVGYYRIYTHNTGTVHNSKMRLEHQQVFHEVKQRLGATRLAALGWSERDERVTRASASLTHGIGYFQEGRREEARHAFADALRATRSPREYITAAAGYVSAATGINLIRQAQRLRAAAGAWTLRLTRGTDR